MGAIIDPEKKNDILPFLKTNFGKISQRKMARKVGVGKTSVNRWCSELGLKHVKHTVNEDFFDRINKESAYVLGYLFADGNINWNPEKGYQSVTITASEKDHEHLEKIRNIISSTKPLLYSEKTRSYRLIANSKKLCKVLMKLGLVPSKSLIVEFPEIPKKYLRHFIRGVIDGDGTVRYVKRKRSPYFEISISSGSHSFLKSVSAILNEHVGIDAGIRKVGKNTYLLQYSCSRGKKLAEWIYHDSGMFLVRKFKHYEAINAKGGGLVPW